MNFRDLIIGATAIAENLFLLTKNLKHFAKLKPFGLKIKTLAEI